MDYYTIAAQRAHIHRTIVGQPLTAVRLFDTHDVFLGFEGDRALRLSATPDMPYLLELEARYLPKKKTFNWQPKRFNDTCLTAVDLMPGDRVLTFTFDNGLAIIFELTGRNANCVLVDRDNIIIGAIRTVTSRESGYRELRQGIGYIAPPPRSYPDPLWSPFQVLRTRFRDGEARSVSDALAASITVMSRPIAREAAIRADIDPVSPSDSLDDDALHRLFSRLTELVHLAESGGEGATVIAGTDGLPRDVAPFKLLAPGQEDRWYEDINEAIYRFARERRSGLETRGLHRSISGALKREKKSLSRTLAKVVADQGADDEPDHLEQAGNALLASLHLIQRGMDRTIVPDPYGGDDIKIDLDPKLNGPANAERMFSRARKLRAATENTKHRLADIERRLAAVNAKLAEVDDIDDINELKRRAAEAQRSANRNRIAADEDRPFPRRFTSVSGLEIIVGRNKKENDELVRWARKNDLWLHAQGVVGSHVVLRTVSRDQRPDHRSIEQAAAIAAHYSKARTSSVVPVACTQVKYVIKRKGQGPGEVTYTREKVYFVEPGIIDSSTV
jgi:predicted ribosome quality control (RQC) complex YloA/Tae2 family protein